MLRYTQRVLSKQQPYYNITRRTLASAAPYFPDEPKQPSMKTAVPGPQSKAIIQHLDKYQDTRSVFFIAGK